MTVYLEWAQIVCLVVASMAMLAWMVTGRNRDWLFTVGNGFAIAAVIAFIAKGFGIH